MVFALTSVHQEEYHKKINTQLQIVSETHRVLGLRTQVSALGFNERMFVLETDKEESTLWFFPGQHPDKSYNRN